MKLTRRLRAVFWDFDGTLVDSRHKNLSVTRTILQQLSGRDIDKIEPLATLQNYEKATRRSTDWRELYVREFGLTEAETEKAGLLWEQLQFEDPTPPVFFEGIEEVLEQLRPLPQGVVSQNSAQLIDKALQRGGVRDHFGPIIGYEDVDRERQKPHPEGLLMGLQQMNLFAECEPGDVVLFVGDHEVDAHCAHRAQAWLEEQGRPLSVRSVAALYGFGDDTQTWEAEPQHRAHNPADVLRVAHSFPGRERPDC